jgi:hypothetical protein
MIIVFIPFACEYAVVVEIREREGGMHRRPAGGAVLVPSASEAAAHDAATSTLHLLTCLPAPAGNRIVVASFYPAVSAWPRALAGLPRRRGALCPPIRERFGFGGSAVRGLLADSVAASTQQAGRPAATT